MGTDTTFYVRCLETLERGYELLLKADPESIDYDLYSTACVKEFELILEQSGKLLKRVLKSLESSNEAIDKLFFNEVFRKAAQCGIISLELVDQFLTYQNLRNSTAHDYGVNLAEETLVQLPIFIRDSRSFIEQITNWINDHS